MRPAITSGFSVILLSPLHPLPVCLYFRIDVTGDVIHELSIGGEMPGATLRRGCGFSSSNLSGPTICIDSNSGCCDDCAPEDHGDSNGFGSCSSYSYRDFVVRAGSKGVLLCQQLSHRPVYRFHGAPTNFIVRDPFEAVAGGQYIYILAILDMANLYEGGDLHYAVLVVWGDDQHNALLSSRGRTCAHLSFVAQT